MIPRVISAETEQGIFEAVLRGHIDFTTEPWPQISKSAKELITHMLDQNPQRRYTAVQVLSEWLLFPAVFRKSTLASLCGHKSRVRERYEQQSSEVC